MQELPTFLPKPLPGLDVFYKVQGTEHNARLSTLVNESLTASAASSTTTTQ